MANGPARPSAVDERRVRGDRTRRERKATTSGEGAASALESWRQIERSRSECAPLDEHAFPLIPERPPARTRRAGR